MIERRYAIGSLGPARAEDATSLAPRLRPSDLLELDRLDGRDAETALADSLANAKFALALCDRGGTPVSLFGVGWVENPRAGRAWFVSAPALDAFALLFLQEVRLNIDHLLAGHDVVSNWVHEPNTKTVRWLEWLGFETLSRRQSPRSGDTFLEMARFADPAVRALYVGRDWAGFHAELTGSGTAEAGGSGRGGSGAA